MAFIRFSFRTVKGIKQIGLVVLGAMILVLTVLIPRISGSSHQTAVPQGRDTAEADGPYAQAGYAPVYTQGSYYSQSGYYAEGSYEPVVDSCSQACGGDGCGCGGDGCGGGGSSG